MKVLITCIPRCGSTYLFRSITGLGPGSWMPRNYTGPVKKKHAFHIDHPREHLVRQWIREENYKTIFLFGDVVDAVVSTRFNRYDPMHFKHCGCDRDPSDVDIYLEDALNYEMMFDSWTQDVRYPLLVLKYEFLYEQENVISDFLEKKIKLMAWKPRTNWRAKISANELLMIESTYSSLIEKVERMPDCYMFRS